MIISKLNNFTTYNKLLILAIVTSPFTDLRFAFFGLTEVIIISAFFYEFSLAIKRKSVKFLLFSRFWIAFLLVSFIGLIYNNFFLDFVNSTVQNTLFDFSAYVVVFMAMFLLESLILRGAISIPVFIKYIFLSLSLILSALFVLSFYTSSIFGFGLLYYNYFVPLTNNLHQISMLLVPLPFMGLLVLKESTTKKTKIIVLALIVVDIIMLYNIGSDKAILGLYTAIGVFILMKFLTIFIGKFKFLTIPIVFLMLSVLLLYNFSSIENLVVDSFQEADTGQGRAILYSDALIIGRYSPLFGLGTGSHIPGINNKLWDAHNTFLTTYLQTGIVGLILLFTLFIRIILKVKSKLFLLMAFSTILVYATGGDILRKPALWVYMILFYYYQNETFKRARQ